MVRREEGADAFGFGRSTLNLETRTERFRFRGGRDASGTLAEGSTASNASTFSSTPSEPRNLVTLLPTLLPWRLPRSLRRAMASRWQSAYDRKRMIQTAASSSKRASGAESSSIHRPKVKDCPASK